LDGLSTTYGFYISCAQEKGNLYSEDLSSCISRLLDKHESGAPFNELSDQAELEFLSILAGRIVLLAEFISVARDEKLDPTPLKWLKLQLDCEYDTSGEAARLLRSQFTAEKGELKSIIKGTWAGLKKTDPTRFQTIQIVLDEAQEVTSVLKIFPSYEGTRAVLSRIMKPGWMSVAMSQS
jgi:hypothetical protein